jgi:hypothetical protein
MRGDATPVGRLPHQVIQILERQPSKSLSPNLKQLRPKLLSTMTSPNMAGSFLSNHSSSLSPNHTLPWPLQIWGDPLIVSISLLEQVFSKQFIVHKSKIFLLECCRFVFWAIETVSLSFREGICIDPGESLTAHCTPLHCSLLYWASNSDLFLCKYFFHGTKTGKVMA